MATYYINPTTGDDGDAGSEVNPWATLTYAVGASSPVTANDTILLREDTYTEFVPVKKSGSDGAPITIAAYEGETPTLEGAAGTEGILEIGAGINYITLGDGMSFSYGHAKPNGVKKFPWIYVHGPNSNPPSNIILQNFSLERAYSTDLTVLAASTWDEYGVLIDGARDTTVSGATMRGIGQGVALRNQCLNATIINCDIQYTVQSCITVGTSLGVIRGVAILHNILKKSAIEDGIQFTQDFSNRADDDTDDTNQGTVVAYNEIGDHGENGIDMKGTTRVLIIGNILYGITGSNNGWSPTSGSNRNSLSSITRGARAYTHRVILCYNIIYNSQRVRMFPDWKAWNNTFVYNNTDYTGSGSSYDPAGANFAGISMGSNEPGMGIRNNIFAGHQSADVAVYAGASQSRNDIDFNLYASKKWADMSAGNPYNLYTDIQAWRARLNTNNWVAGKDSHSISVANHAAVQFANVPAAPTGDPSSYDFNILSSSPGKEAGGWLTRTVGTGAGDDWVIVGDSTWFDTVYGREDVIDRLRVFFNGQERAVIDIDDDNNRIQLDAVATWANDTPVYGIGPGWTATDTPDMGAGGFLAQSGGGGTPPEEPPASGSGARSTVRVACATSTGQQTITLDTALTEQPVAWTFKVTLATADDTATDGAMMGWGWAWDNSGSIVEGAGAIRSKHNNNPADTSRRTINDGCILIISATNGAILGQANLVLASSDETQIVVDWTVAPGSGYLLIAEAHAGVEAYFGKFDIPATLDAATTITCGFQPDYIEVWSCDKPIPDNSGNIQACYGMATITSGTITQQALMWSSQDNGTTAIGAYLSNADIGGRAGYTGTLLQSLRLQNLTSTSFDIATKTASYPDGTSDGYVFALKYTGVAVYSGVVAMPTSPDSAYEHAVGFTAGQANVIATTLTAINTADAAGTGFALGVWDGVNQYSASIADQDNLSTSNTQSLSDDRFINLSAHTGTSMALATISAVGNDLVGNYSAVDGTARYMILVAFQEVTVASVTAVGSPDVTSGVAPLSVDFTDESTADGTTIDEWLWDFGDGNTSTSQNPTHEYTDAGEYTVTLTVGDGTVSDSTTLAETILVTAAPAAPPDPTGQKVLVSASVPAVVAGDIMTSVDVTEGVSQVDNTIYWSGYGSADVNTNYIVKSDETTSGTFATLATQNATDRGDASYAPYTAILVGNLSATDEVVEMGDATDFANGQRIKLGRETILLGGKSSNTFGACSRGVDNTIPRSHTDGDTITAMHESYTDSSVTYGSRNLIRYRIIAELGDGGDQLVAAEAVAVKPTKPPTNDLCTVWGIVDEIPGTPQSGVAASLSISDGTFYNTATGETFGSGPSDTTDEDGYFELFVPKDAIRSGGALTITVNGKAQAISSIPDVDAINYLECI